MKCLTHLLLLTAIIICVTVQYSSGYRNDISKAFPLGIIGCKVSDVCRVDQLCEDDKLFGSCHSIDNLDLGVTFELTIPELKQLEAELLELKSQGFSWQDAFTQCILQNAIIAFAKRQSINLKDYCEYVLSMDESSWSESTKMEIAAVLERLLEANEVQEEPVFDGNANWDLRSNSDKRDEIVEVHKYFDQSKGLKRNVLSELNEVPYNYLSQNSPLLEEDTSRLDEQAFGSPEQITAYLRVLDQLSNRAKLASTGKEVPQIYTDVRETMDTRNQEVGMEASMIAGTNNNKDPLNKDDTVNSIFSEVNEDAKGDEDAEDEYLTISPPDEKALEKLLSGDLDPHDIEMEQLKRLMKIVEIMVQQLDEEEIETGVKELTQTEDQILTPEEKNDEIKSDNQVAIMLPEKQDVVVDSDNIVVPGDDLIVSADKNLVPSNHLSLDKKAIDKAVAEESNKHEDEKPESLPSADDVVDMRYAYITLDRNIDEVEGGAFLEAFASVINLPTSSLNDVMILGDKITFEIQENPKYNASMVADKAENEEIIARLQKLTGLTILKAGIGKENQVEVRKNDNKYLVLTFILVGCIAGILLAVVVIYLIKRQSRSKEKLAELAEGAEGNEASKDYQDLCRQRMQSKSSEKPEPLHAASRIGSVSDQVRSPSSRSSTSSWSEEPVQSNMDISTGHIVLSYMEDHLNNQDRLDTEWESLSGYEAEPCNTKVASDAANMRKNRYGDILPYDHSRVVLTSAANVSGSDYINANFITDHDPRNPAFVVTQGTLPHTVADFWQMVWEQGSVVIVMLTKLTENGSSMCHRYWPEEGSDLYHIYEVHLVSEHTWCDDYLVRSFYLKNLQTNETRTVTQFHFVTWPNLGVPGSIKALLDFRRKVNKSYRGRSCPIVVHCSDGCDRSGTYILIDMVLNRMAKGAKEIDMAATLEHIRDQRMSMVKTKEQFQFALASVAEEVHAILKALPQ